MEPGQNDGMARFNTGQVITVTVIKRRPKSAVIELSKGLFLWFNIIFMVIGFIVMVIGIWMFWIRAGMAPIFVNDAYDGSASVLILTGIIIYFIAALGYYGARTENRTLLNYYYLGLFLVFCLECVVGILAITAKKEIREDIAPYVRSAFLDAIIDKYDSDPHVDYTNALDFIQEELHCCGADTAGDWGKSKTEAQWDVPPISCCEDKFNCNTNKTADLKHKGCVVAIVEEMEDDVELIGAIALGFSIFNIVGMLLTRLLARAVKYQVARVCLDSLYHTYSTK